MAWTETTRPQYDRHAYRYASDSSDEDRAIAFQIWFMSLFRNLLSHPALLNLMRLDPFDVSALMMYVHFPLSLRNVKDQLHQRGIYLGAIPPSG